MDDVRMVYVTAPDAAVAQRLARVAVEERLAACGNVLPAMTSVYRWRGAIEEASEAVLLLKTVQARVPSLVARLRALHPYEQPCIVALPIVGGDGGFLAWVREEVASG